MRWELRGKAASMAELAAGLLCTAGAEEEPAAEPRRAQREEEELGVGEGREETAGKSAGATAGTILEEGAGWLWEHTLFKEGSSIIV